MKSDGAHIGRSRYVEAYDLRLAGACWQQLRPVLSRVQFAQGSLVVHVLIWSQPPVQHPVDHRERDSQECHKYRIDHRC